LSPSPDSPKLSRGTPDIGSFTRCRYCRLASAWIWKGEPLIKRSLVFVGLLVALPGMAPAEQNFKVSPTHSVSSDRYLPDVAYNWRHDEYLVVWHNLWPGDTRDVYAQRIKANGDLAGPWFCVSCGTNDRFAPSVAYDSSQDGYLVVWTYDAEGDGTRYSVMGKRIPFNGPGTESELSIFSVPAQPPVSGSSGWFPVVENDPDRHRYLVAWDKTSLGPMVTPDGLGHTFVGTTGLPDPPRPLMNTTGAHQVDVAYHSGQSDYLFVWRLPVGPGLAEIWGVRVDGATGNTVGGPGAEFRISNASSANERLFPSVAAASAEFYTVAWQQLITGDYDIVAVYLPAANPPVYAGVEDLIADDFVNETAPHVLATDQPGRFAIAYQKDTASGNQAVTLTSVSLEIPWPAQVTHEPDIPVYDFSFSDAEQPVTAASGKETLVIFEQQFPAAEREIWGWTPTILRDGFESGNTGRWSAAVP
jgi:hypothetical protein